MLDLLRERGARPHQGVRRRRRRDRARPRSRSCTTTASTRIFSPEDGQRLGLAGHDQRDRRGVRRRSRARRCPRRCDALRDRRPHASARARSRGSSPGSRAARVPAKLRAALLAAAAKCEGPDARHHRHRRRGQELAHRRARAPLPPRPGGRAADRDHLDRSVAAQVRRRAARRPHPHERDRASEHLHALARHARRGQRGQQGAAGRDRRLQGRGLRPRHRRDLRASGRATPRSCRWSTSRST